MLGTLERLAKAKALRDTTLSEAAAPVDQVKRRVALRKTAESLRALLLGRSTAGLSSMDLFDVAGSVAMLNDRLAEVKASGDALDVGNTSAYLRILGERLYRTAKLTGDDDAAAKADSLVAVAMDGWVEQMKESHQTAMANRYLAQPGASMVEEAMAEADKGLTPEQVAQATLAEDVRIERDRLDQAYASNRRAIRDTRAMFKGEFEAGRLSIAEYLQSTRIMDERSVAIINQINAELQSQFGAEAMERLGQSEVVPAKEFAGYLLHNLAAVSPVTAEQATKWAQAQEVTASAKAALKRIGYPHEDLRADIAEFYRLTGGRLAKVRIKASTGRPSASEIHGHKNRTINMGAGFNKRTLFHELGHHLEADPQVYAAARGFLVKRRESDKLYSLRSLTGNSSYRRDEVAYKDSWTNPYVGKRYKYDVTEVISMGMEAFSSEAAMAQCARHDPEHVRLVAGFLTATQDPLFESVKRVFAQQADAEEDIVDESQKVIAAGLKDLAAGVEFVKVEPAPSYYMPGLSYAGTWTSRDSIVAMYEGKVRDPVTKRLRKGMRLVGTVTGAQWLSNVTAFSLEEAKAQSRVFSREGRFIPELSTSAATAAFMASSHASAS